eukprot:TRINITY_DN7391_c1_g1_i2.p1 TRINITY_DN7391_c1_g1~~TRINITY_DN7391_c1_g1_i2.p1  ORF type:complete len:845 (+),score=215.66 TRINITY_DN7391_c1_g1_i2:85-2535(+)
MPAPAAASGTRPSPTPRTGTPQAGPARSPGAMSSERAQQRWQKLAAGTVKSASSLGMTSTFRDGTATYGGRSTMASTARSRRTQPAVKGRTAALQSAARRGSSSPAPSVFRRLSGGSSSGRQAPPNLAGLANFRFVDEGSLRGSRQQQQWRRQSESWRRQSVHRGSPPQGPRLLIPQGARRFSVQPGGGQRPRQLPQPQPGSTVRLPRFTAAGTAGVVSECALTKRHPDGSCDVLVWLRGVPAAEVAPAAPDPAPEPPTTPSACDNGGGAPGPPSGVQPLCNPPREQFQLSIERCATRSRSRSSQASTPRSHAQLSVRSARSGRRSPMCPPRMSPRSHRLLTFGADAISEEQSLDALFRHMDEDSSGTLDVAEIVRFMNSNPQWAAYAGLTKGYSEFLEIMDADQSGEVDYKEFCAGLRELRRRAICSMDEREYRESLKTETDCLKRQLEEFLAGRERRKNEDPLARSCVSAAGKGNVWHGSMEFTDRRGKTWRRSGQMLGKGAFGEVWLAMSQQGELVAMKTLRLPLPSAEEHHAEGAQQVRQRRRRKSQVPGMEEALADTLQEVAMLCELRHDNIVTFFSSYLCPHARTLSILMEYLSGGSLMHVLNGFGALPGDAVRRYMHDALAGLAYLHERNIVHRDMKPGNVLLDPAGRCKLTDFGTCAKVAHMLSGGKASSGPIGTPVYMAPEAAMGEAIPASDVWSFGVTLLQLLTAELPWDCEAESEGRPEDVERVPTPPGENFNIHAFLYRLGRVESMVPIIPDPDELDHQPALFAQSCLFRDPAKRRTAVQLLADSYMKDAPAPCSILTPSVRNR